jgi:tRNA-intron endonuclease, archaea type
LFRTNNKLFNPIQNTTDYMAKDGKKRADKEENGIEMAAGVEPVQLADAAEESTEASTDEAQKEPAQDEQKAQEARGREDGQQKKSKEIVKTHFTKTRVLTENTDAARELYNQSRYGSMLEDGRLQLSLHEALYLMEKGKIIIMDSRNRPMDYFAFLRRTKKLEPNFWVRYCVFKNIRNRGYIIKTALKFGADFRIYDRGIKPGEDHAKWVVFPVHEASTLTWHDFAAKNRVAHSTKKRLLLAVVDDEADVSYWEARWVRP